MNIGELVRNRRKELSMTQVELAKDICTQAMVSKIEKGLINPSSHLIKMIADRLNVSVSYFYEDEIEEQHLKEIEKKIRFLLNQEETDKVKALLDENKDLFYQSEKDTHIAFYEISLAYIDYVEDQNGDKLISLLNQRFDDISSTAPLYPNLLSLIGLVYFEMEDYDKAHEMFDDAIVKMNSQTDSDLKTRTLYLSALNLKALDRQEEAMEITLQTIEDQICNESLYNLGSLYYLKANLLFDEEEYASALEEYNNAALLFKIMNYQKIMPEVAEKIKETEALIK